MARGFLRPDKFKIIFSVVFIIITAGVFFLAAEFPNLNTQMVNTVFAILYFPAAVFVFSFSQLPIFKMCSLSFGYQLCIYDQTVAVWLSIPVFLIWVYLLACAADKFIVHSAKAV